MVTIAPTAPGSPVKCMFFALLFVNYRNTRAHLPIPTHSPQGARVLTAGCPCTAASTASTPVASHNTRFADRTLRLSLLVVEKVSLSSYVYWSP